MSFYGQNNSTIVKEHQVFMEYKIKSLNLLSRIEDINITAKRLNVISSCAKTSWLSKILQICVLINIDQYLKKRILVFSTWRFVLLINVLTIIVFPMSSSALTIAREGQSYCSIVLADHASTMEKTAASEIAHYLSQVTGGKFVVKAEKKITGSENKNLIYVGFTKFSSQKRIKSLKLDAEEWIIKTVQNNLIIVGGHPRGTLYAAYHFLEDIVGVHWWNPWEGSVPTKRTFVVNNLDLRGKPIFHYRDIYMLYGNDGGLFAVRNRLNRQGDALIAPDYGGGMDYGPPYHVHTFYMYIEPKQYFKEHPEWFSLINGRRTADKAQLCLTNPKLRELVLSKLKEFISCSQMTANELGAPPPRVFNISQNDWAGACQCENCQTIAKREGSEAGPLIDFVNYMANGIRNQYPDVYIDTLAYDYTENPPNTIKPLNNVIVRLCNTTSNLTKSITDKDNTAFRKLLLRWEKISKNLRVWNYAVTYDPNYGMPLPSLRTYPDDYRFYAKHNVSGIFTEHEYAIHADMRDFKIWIMMKLLENPDANYKTLVDTFTDGFYGPAGQYVREYVALLEQAADKRKSYIKLYPSLPQYRYLTPDFICEAQTIFNKAEEAVLNDPLRLRRVRHARLSLDRATIILYPLLMVELGTNVNDIKKSFLNRDFISQRYLQTVYEQIDLRMPKNRGAIEKQKANEELKQLLAH